MEITTTKGVMDESLLEKKEGLVDNENEHTTWVEYWHEGELVHRSAHVTLKRTPLTALETQQLGQKYGKYSIHVHIIPWGIDDWDT